MSIRSLSWSLAAATLCLSAAGGAQAQINITGDVTNVSCFSGSNGSVQTNITNGVAPYTYSWSHGETTSAISGRPVGIYTVTATDNIGSSATKSFTITQPSALVAAAQSQTNVSGIGNSNGSATVRVSGGTPGYSYIWAPSGGSGATANNLTAGTYTVTVLDANYCSATKTFTITEAAAAPAATVTSVGVPPSGTYMPPQALAFTVNFSEAVTVDTSGGTPRIPLTVGVATRYATYSSGSGSSALDFQYIIRPGDVDSDGITINAIDLNGATIRNGSTNVNLTLNGVGSTTGVLVGGPPPAPVPTLTEWAMILLAGLLGLFGLSQVMQRRRTV